VTLLHESSLVYGDSLWFKSCTDFASRSSGAGRLPCDIGWPRQRCANPFLVHPSRRITDALQTADSKDVGADPDEARAIDHCHVVPAVWAWLERNGLQPPLAERVAAQLSCKHTSWMVGSRAELDASVVCEFDRSPHAVQAYSIQVRSKSRR
jgi:hypothetical protein